MGNRKQQLKVKNLPPYCPCPAVQSVSENAVHRVCILLRNAYLQSGRKDAFIWRGPVPFITTTTYTKFIVKLRIPYHFSITTCCPNHWANDEVPHFCDHATWKREYQIVPDTYRGKQFVAWKYPTGPTTEVAPCTQIWDFTKKSRLNLEFSSPLSHHKRLWLAKWFSSPPGCWVISQIFCSKHLLLYP